MTTYRKANQEAIESVSRMCTQYHPDLEGAGVTFDVLLAFGPRDENEDTTSPAIKVRGHACSAKVKIVSLKDRVAGRADAEIVLDGDHCDEWGDDEMDAIVDHELTHLELVVNDKGAVKRDDHERPRLRIRHHDREFGWFDGIARRHGLMSVEVNQSSFMLRDQDLRQLYFPWVSGVAEVKAPKSKVG